MGSILILVGVGILAVLGLSVVWPKLKGQLPTSVQSIGNKAEVAIDKATAAAALQTLVALFSERGDTATVEALGKLWVSIWAWRSEDTVTPSPDASASSTLQFLAEEIETLRAQIAGGKAS